MPNPYEGDEVVQTARLKKRLALIIASIVALVLLSVATLYVYELIRDPDFYSYADEQITLSGLQDDTDITITPSELYKFYCQEITVTGTGMGSYGESKAGTVSAFGPTLKTFLQAFGCEPADFRRIKFTCKDGYDVIIRGETLTYDIYLSFASGKDALFEVQQPLRIVIPDETSGKWAYGVTRIDFYK